MKAKKVTLFSLVAIVLLSLGSCTNRILDFTLVSTKNVDMSKASSFERGRNRVTGTDFAHIIIFIPTGSISIKEAVDQAIESTPGCVALLDGVIYTKFFYIPYIYGKSTAIIEGTPLIDRSIAESGSQIAPYKIIELDKDGKVKKVENISSEEYLASKSKIVKESKAMRFNNSNVIQ